MKRGPKLNALERGLAVGALAVLLSLASAATASAIRISEVYAGHGAGASQTSEFVELQMDGAGQNTVQSLHVLGYNGSGGQILNYLLPSNVANSESQRSVLIASSDAAAEFGQASDEGPLAPQVLGNSGGAVCIETIDCVSWGSFPEATALPSPAGPPEAVIPDGSSISRSMAAGCPTLLELADDTDNSLNDFSATSPTPRNNAAAPAGTPCPPPATPTAAAAATTTTTTKKKCKKGQKLKTVKGKRKCVKKKRKK